MDLSQFSFSSLVEEFRGYSTARLKRDLFAGLQVALLAIPQAMAYAMVAGMPLSAGIFAAIFSCFFAAMVGSSRYLVIGPVNAIALLIQFEIADILYTFYRDVSGIEREVLALSILAQLAFLVGVFQVLIAIFKLGRLTQFISHSVVVGYVTGVALSIIIHQLFPFLGISSLNGLPTLFDDVIYLFTHLNLVHGPTLAVGISTFLIMAFVGKRYPLFPAPLVAFVVLSAFIFSWNSASSYFAGAELPSFVALVGDSLGPGGLSIHFAFPQFQGNVINELFPLAFAVTLLSTMESMIAAKGMSATTGTRIYNNQEIFALGIGNLTSSFIGALPVSVSVTRSTLNYRSGANTRFAAIFNALFVGIIILLFGSLLGLIPQAALSALLLLTAVKLIDLKQFMLCLKTTPSDAYVLLATILGSLFFSLDVAFYIGLVVSITFYLNKAATPQLVEYAIEESGDLKSLDPTQTVMPKAIRVIKVDGELFFGAADLFENTLKAIAEHDNTTQVIILQLRNARDLDATSCLALHQLTHCLKASGRSLIVCGMSPTVWDVMSNAGLIQDIGKENIFLFDEKRPHLYLQRALSHAKALLKEARQPRSESPVGIPNSFAVSSGG